MAKKLVTSRSEDGLLYFQVDQTMIEKALGDLKSESRKVLKNAVNATAKQAKADLVRKAQEEYTAKKSSLNKATTKTNATVAKPTATIEVSGEPLELKEFKTTTPKSGAKAQILKSSSLKLIQSQKGNRAKAFLATFESGHSAIVQRDYGKQYRPENQEKRRGKWGKGADMTRIKKLLSVSAPKMIGDERRVFGILRPKIYENLINNINVEIDRVLSKR